MNKRTGLFRSRTDRIIGGVAGGIAASLNTDSSLIRVIFVLLAIFGGGGVLLYLILWIALPEDDLPYYMPSSGEKTEEGEDTPGREPTPVDYPHRRDGSLIAGIILIVIGGAFLTERFLPRLHFGDFWPIIIVLAGVIIIATGFTQKKPE